MKVIRKLDKQYSGRGKLRFCSIRLPVAGLRECGWDAYNEVEIEVQPDCIYIRPVFSDQVADFEKFKQG